MNQPKINAVEWFDKLTVRVGMAVIHNDGYWINISGKNTEPSNSSDWIYDGAFSPNSEGGGGDVFTEDILVKLGANETFGKYKNNDIIPAIGKTSVQVIKDATTKNIPATYTQPVSTISGTSNVDIESGTTLEISLNGGFNQNDAGVKIGSKIFKNGSEVSSTNLFTESIKLSSPVTYRHEATYEDGLIKNDNLGNPSPGGQIKGPGPAVSLNRVYTPLLKRFFGPAIVNLTDHRTLPSVFDNTSLTWILNTGTIYNNFYIDIPNGRDLVSVIDLDALNLNITNLFNLTSGNIPDAGGDNQSYKKLLMSSDNPYPSNHRFQITIALKYETIRK